MAVTFAVSIDNAMKFLKEVAETLWVEEFDEHDSTAYVVLSKATYDQSWNLSIYEEASKKELRCYGGSTPVEVLNTAINDALPKLKELADKLPKLATKGMQLQGQMNRPNLK